MDAHRRSGRRTGLPEDIFTVKLGEAPYGPESGLMGMLNGLARSGLPVPEGVVLTRKAHEEFLRTSGLMGRIREACEDGEAGYRHALALLREYEDVPLGEALNQALREALIDLSARSVRVVWPGGVCCDLRSIPEVREAVRDAWMYPKDLERQLVASLRGKELPTWPVLIQREVHPEYTGWTNTAAGATGALHDVRPTQRDARGVRGIPEHTAEAASALGEPVRLEWGLEGGQWYVLTVK